MWAVGRYDLRLSDRDFWLLTPREFHALWKRFNLQMESENQRTALVCTVLAEIHRDPKKRHTPFRVGDFMPSTSEEKRVQTVEEMLQVARLATKTFSGRKKRGKDEAGKSI